MIKKFAKFFIIVFIVATILNFLNCKAYAADNMSDIIQEGKDFLAARDSEPVIDPFALRDTSNFIYKTLLTIAIVLAFIVGMIIGIQFIIGSVEEKAKIKETLVPYIIGLVVVFGAFTIWKIAVNIGDEIAPTPDATGKTGSIPPGTENIGDTQGMNEKTLHKCPQCSENIDGMYSAIWNRGWSYCTNCNRFILNSNYNNAVYVLENLWADEYTCYKCGHTIKTGTTNIYQLTDNDCFVSELAGGMICTNCNSLYCMNKDYIIKADSINPIFLNLKICSTHKIFYEGSTCKECAYENSRR